MVSQNNGNSGYFVALRNTKVKSPNLSTRGTQISISIFYL